MMKNVESEKDKIAIYGTYEKQWKRWNKKIRKQNTVTQRDNMKDVESEKNKMRYTVQHMREREID